MNEQVEHSKQITYVFPLRERRGLIGSIVKNTNRNTQNIKSLERRLIESEEESLGGASGSTIPRWG